MQSDQITRKQKEVLDVIRELIQLNGQSPTLEEIREAMNYSHTSNVQRHITPLIEKGYVTNRPHKSRSLKLVEEEVEVLKIPLVGSASCGKPVFAEEDIEAYIPYNKENTSYPAKELFFLRASGDSMNKANIRGKTIENGDYVLIHKQSDSDNNTSVVALIGTDATIKMYRKNEQENIYSLEPISSNKKHKPILLLERFYIQGKVIDVLKPNLN